jgi:hypothetical protein
MINCHIRKQALLIILAGLFMPMTSLNAGSRPRRRGQAIAARPQRPKVIKQNSAGISVIEMFCVGSIPLLAAASGMLLSIYLNEVVDNPKTTNKEHGLYLGTATATCGLMVYLTRKYF